MPSIIQLTYYNLMNDYIIALNSILVGMRGGY
jgi:hypothetical protein